MTTSAPADAWDAAADARRRVGHAIEFVPVIGSTNDRARALLAETGGEGTVVVADLQTEGRGRLGRIWQSPSGLNLTLSVGLRPRLAAADAWMLSATAALAVLDATRRHASLVVKWPNDILAPDGGKVAGILIETSIDGERVRDATVGIGLNVNWLRHEMPADLASGATSLADLAGERLDRVALLGSLLDHLDAGVAALEAGSTPLARYRRACVTLGREVAVETSSGRIEGQAVGLDDHGGLIVETSDGPVTVTSGDVVGPVHGDRG
jgi:BirA family transcriptional regulator, biotin operon repressor / biotin---[acetyl-CoA-carboxylase] ligase